MTLPTRIVVTTALVLALGGLVALLPLLAESVEPRTVVVVARQMSFYVGEDKASNPTISAAPGESIRIIFVNEDSGFDHDFSVTAWAVRTPVVHGKGRTSIELQVPPKPGKVAYLCSIHASMMMGTIEVVAPGSLATSER